MISLLYPDTAGVPRVRNEEKVATGWWINPHTQSTDPVIWTVGALECLGLDDALLIETIARFGRHACRAAGEGPGILIPGSSTSSACGRCGEEEFKEHFEMLLDADVELFREVSLNYLLWLVKEIGPQGAGLGFGTMKFCLNAARVAEENWLRPLVRYTNGNGKDWKPHVYSNFQKTVCAAYWLGLGEKFLKSIVVALAATLSDQEYPPSKFSCVKGHVFLGGGGYCWLSALCRSGLAARLEYSQTVNQSKNAFADAHANRVVEEAFDTISDLTRDPLHNHCEEVCEWVRRHGPSSFDLSMGDPAPLPYDFPPELDSDPHPRARLTLMREVRRTVRELYSKVKVPPPEPRIPSSSGHLDEYGDPVWAPSCKNGGAFGTLHMRALRMNQRCVCCTRTVESDPYRLEHICSAVKVDVFLWLPTKQEVKLVGLVEPLKVRIISLGDSATYTHLARWQKPFWSIRDHPAMRLIGSPTCAEIPFLSERIGTCHVCGPQCPSDCPEEEVISSIDYRGATNNLHPWLSRACAMELATVLDMPEADTLVFLSSLLESDLKFADPKWEPPSYNSNGTLKKRLVPIRTQGTQSWGQLMGHPLSFIVLCIVNLAVIRFAYELDRKRTTPKYRVSLARLPANVNGDDGVVKWRKSARKIWEPLTSLAGLAPSPGKCWESTKFFSKTPYCLECPLSPP
jgi:hypothetical protein